MAEQYFFAEIVFLGYEDQVLEIVGPFTSDGQFLEFKNKYQELIKDDNIGIFEIKATRTPNQALSRLKSFMLSNEEFETWGYMTHAEEWGL